MNNKSEKPVKDAPKTREDRLKVALKANMAKRKAQAKARAGAQNAPQTEQKE